MYPENPQDTGTGGQMPSLSPLPSYPSPIQDQPRPDASTTGNQSNDQDDNKNPRDKKWWIIGGAGALIVILIVVGLALTLSSNNTASKTATVSDKNTTSDQSQAPQPATSLSIEQTNSAISQDLSTLNDDTDFPAGVLDDQTLGL